VLAYAKRVASCSSSYLKFHPERIEWGYQRHSYLCLCISMMPQTGRTTVLF